MKWICYFKFALLWNNMCSIYNATVFLHITLILHLDSASASEISGIDMEDFLRLLKEQLLTVDVEMLKYILRGSFTGTFFWTFNLLALQLTEC